MMKEKAKTLFAMMLCALALIVLPTTAAQAKTKNKNQGKAGKKATWSYNEKKKVLTISGKGSVKATDLKKKGKTGELLWLGKEDGSLPMFKKIVFTEGITTIDYCFFYLENVKTISLPKSFKKVQYSSYIGDINGRFDPWSTTLKKITVHKKNKKFMVSGGVLFSKNGKKLYVFPSGKKADAYKIPNKVTNIEQYAFWGADIRKVTIGNKVTRIDDNAFCNSALTEVVFGKRVKRIGCSAFRNCVLSQVKLPDSLSYIDSYAFYACPITEITIPSKVTKVREYAFAENHKLKKIVLQGNASVEATAFTDTTKYYRYEDDVNVQAEQPVTVVLGKNMKANVDTLCKDLGSQIAFQIENGNPKYYVKNGNLYTIRGDKLIYEPKKEDPKTETPPANIATGSGVQI